jgi:transketolase
VPHLDRSNAKEAGVARGGYILAEAAGGAPDVILIGTGSEVALCMQAREKLAESRREGARGEPAELGAVREAGCGVPESVLPKAIRKRVTVEAGATLGWSRYAGDEGVIIGLDRYGASAPGGEVLQYFGFTADRVTTAALGLLSRTKETA